MQIITDDRCTAYSKSGHPERPERILHTRRRLREDPLPHTQIEALEAEEAALLRVHTPRHLARLLEPVDFDANTPWYPGIGEVARRSAGAALQAMAAVRNRIILVPTAVP